jgi:predicted transcriptional regulator
MSQPVRTWAQLASIYKNVFDKIEISGDIVLMIFCFLIQIKSEEISAIKQRGRISIVVIDVRIIGEIIRCEREEKSLSQEVLSGLAGLERTHYSKIERGLRCPTIETLFRIADALEIPPHELIKKIENAHKASKI